jgi:hypothetical protein
MTLRPELTAIVDALAARGGDVSIDDLGDAIGVRAVTPDEIDAMMRAIEARGIAIVAPAGGAEKHLGAVVKATRALRAELGRTPTIAEVAARAAIAETDVRHALALARVMQR